MGGRRELDCWRRELGSTPPDITCSPIRCDYTTTIQYPPSSLFFFSHFVTTHATQKKKKKKSQTSPWLSISYRRSHPNTFYCSIFYIFCIDILCCSCCCWLWLNFSGGLNRLVLLVAPLNALWCMAMTLTWRADSTALHRAFPPFLNIMTSLMMRQETIWWHSR